jgi:hypothetical protein
MASRRKQGGLPSLRDLSERFLAGFEVGRPGELKIVNPVHQQV